MADYGNNVRGIKPKWTSHNGNFEINEYLCELFFNGYYHNSTIKNEELNINNYHSVHYYLSKFFKPLIFLMGIPETREVIIKGLFIPNFENVIHVPRFGFCFNFLNKTRFPDDFNIGFIRDYLICIKELLDCIIQVGNDFKNTDNNYVDEDDKKEKEKEKEKEKMNLLESRLKGVEEKYNVLNQNLTSTIHEMGELQDNPMLSKRGGKKIVKSKKRKYNKQNKSRRRH